MELLGGLAVGFLNFIVGGGRLDAYEGVEGSIDALVLLDFVVQTKDFMV